MTVLLHVKVCDLAEIISSVCVCVRSVALILLLFICFVCLIAGRTSCEEEFESCVKWFVSWRSCCVCLKCLREF